MKMDLRMKATLLVGLITYLSSNSDLLHNLDHVFGSVVNMRDSQGNTTREGKAVQSAFFMLVTYMVMSRRGRK